MKANERRNNIQTEFNRVQNKYGKFCKPPDLSEALLNPYFSNSQSNCIYVIGQAYKVIQSLPNGVLVGFIGFNEFDPKIIHIKTNQKFIDGQFINPMYAKPNGLFKYITAFQTQKTVSSFVFLEPAPQFLFNEY